MEVVYLACPYKHEDSKIMQARVTIATHMACRLIKQGILVYSPLTHDIPINECGIFGDWQTWKNHNHEMLSRCDRLLILKLPGWELSKGMQGEIAKAKMLGIPFSEIEADSDLLEQFLSEKMIY